MTRLVPVAPGIDASIPTGPQLSAKYTLTGPDGTRAVFNDPTDRDYIGMLTDITGLDSPEIRESAEELVQADGGLHGDFFYSRRPMTLSGLVLNPLSPDDRNRRMTKLQRASNAMRGDAVLSWILDGGYEQFVLIRRQQPLRITGGWQKEFQLGMVAADPRIYGVQIQTRQLRAGAVFGEVGRTYDKGYDMSYGGQSISGQAIIVNRGNTLTWPLLTVYGPGVNPVLTNFTTGQSIRLNYSLLQGEFLVVDTLNRTVMLNNQQSRYAAVDFVNTDWWGLEPGSNDVRVGFTSFSTGAALVVQFRDAWL